MSQPVFYMQERPGLNSRIFHIIKFRTMNDAKNEFGYNLPDAQRITRLGTFMRRCSLDEIPQLINVIKGDMSLVGPRPLAVKYLPYYSAEEMIRHNVKPGMTGLAQINGRNGLDWDKKLQYDIEYANNLSFSLDITILIKTFFKIMQRSDVSRTGVDAPGDFDQYRLKQAERTEKNDY